MIELLLAKLAIAMVLYHRWQTRMRRRAALARSGVLRAAFERAAADLDHPALGVRLEAVRALWTVAEDFPDLAGTVRELLAARLREGQGRYDDRPLPADLREIGRVLRGPRPRPPGDVIWPWSPHPPF